MEKAPTEEKALRRNQRRRVPRISVDSPDILTWGRKQFRCQARQLSEFGIFVGSTHHELVGENVQVNVTLESSTPPLSLLGIVIYATDSGLGIRFEDVTPEHHASLKSYVQARGIGVVKP